jgi:carbon storage regulator
MLVLSRKMNERIQIGDDITITVVRVSPNSVRIGVNAPPHMVIARDELNASAVPVEHAEGVVESPTAS